MRSDSRPLWRRMLVPGLSIVALILVGLGIPLAWMLSSSRSEWEKLRAELQARGEKLTIEELTPPLPPPERNFFADPMWLELTDLVATRDSSGMPIYETRLPENKRQLAAMYGPIPPSAVAMAEAVLKPRVNPFTAGDRLDDSKWTVVTRPFQEEHDDAKRRALARLVIELFSGGAPFRARLERLLRDRPEAVFPVDLTKYAPGYPCSWSVRKLGRIYSELVQAHLALDDRVTASNDIFVLLRLSGSLRREPGMLSLHIRGQVANHAMNAIMAGIKGHLWTTGDLQSFEQELARIDLVADLPFALRSDRAEFNRAFSIAESAPTPTAAWDLIYAFPWGSGNWRPKSYLMEKMGAAHRLTAPGDQSFYNRHIQSLLDGLAGSDAPHPRRLLYHEITSPTLFVCTHFLSSMRAQPLRALVARVFHTQDLVQQSRVACALENHRLAHHAYPASLEVLPETLARPVSPIGCAPMHYVLESNGSFRLWSDGWNEIDDGGATSRNFEEADWVWGAPPRSALSH